MPYLNLAGEPAVWLIADFRYEAVALALRIFCERETCPAMAYAGRQMVPELVERHRNEPLNLPLPLALGAGRAR